MFRIDEPQTVQEALDKIEGFNKFIKGAEKKGFIAGQEIEIQITVKDNKELKALADLYKANYFEPCTSLPYHWCFITIGRIKAQFKTKELKVTFIED